MRDKDNKPVGNTIRTDLARRLVNELYQGQGEQRSSYSGTEGDRRRGDRRTRNEPVLLDTRSNRSRRNTKGRRWDDDNPDNQHKIGINRYA